MGGKRRQLVWKRRVHGEGSYLRDEFCFSHVVFEEAVIHTQLETSSARLNKVSLELGRTGNKDLGLEAVVAKVIRKDKAWIF